MNLATSILKISSTIKKSSSLYRDRHKNNERNNIRNIMRTLKKPLTSNTEIEVLEFKQAKNQFDKKS